MLADNTDIGKALIDGAVAAFQSNKGWADKAIVQLPDDRLHVALDPTTNSIAARIVSHRTRRSGSASASRSSEVPAR